MHLSFILILALIKIKIAAVVHYSPDVTLLDQDTGVMNGFGHARLKHKSLEASLQEVLHGESQHIIELVLAFIEKTIPVHASQQSLSLEDTTSVLLIQGQQHTSIVADTAQSVLHPPKLTLVAETILSDQLQLSIETLLLEGPARLLKSLPIYPKTKTSYQNLIHRQKTTITETNTNILPETLKTRNEKLKASSHR
jgi:hypothetical protein